MIANQINQIIKNEKISVRKFEQKISVTQGVISKCTSGNTDVSSNVVTLIVKNFPQYSAEWLLTGEGEMLKEAVPSPESETDREWKSLYYEQKSLLENQTKMIERLEIENKKLAAQVEGNVECADADMKITG